MATYKYSQQVADQQVALNAKGANLKVDGYLGPLTQAAIAKYETPKAPEIKAPDDPSNKYRTDVPNTLNTKYIAPDPINPVVDATDVNPTNNIKLPTPTASNIENSYITSLTSNVEKLRTQLEDTYSKKEEDLKTEKATLKEEQKKLLENIDPTKRETYDQETRITQNQLDAAESASATLKEDFEKRRSLTSELEQLLTEGNTLIEQQRNLPVGQKVVDANVNKTMRDVTARAGVIEAVFSALDGNITQAHSIINNANTAVSAQWKDELDYYNTLLTLNNNDLISIDTDSKKIADEKVKLITGDLEKAEKTAEYIKGLMTSPEAAQFMAEAGITLTDSVEEINTKMSAQSKVEEIKDIKNQMALKGYIYVPFPSKGSNLVTVSAGGQTLSFKEPPEKAKTTTTEPLSILDIQRYQELYPDAGITAGDTEAVANSKASKSSSPEAQTRNLITAAKDNGNDYNTIVKEINNDKEITDKATALSIAKEVYGIKEDATNTKIEADIQKFIGTGQYSSKVNLQNALERMGYSSKEIAESSASDFMYSAYNFLFN